MKDPQLIPDSQISTSTGKASDIRPDDDTPWTSSAADANPSVVIVPQADGAVVELGDITIPTSTSENIEAVRILIQGDDDDKPQPFNPENPTSDQPKVGGLVLFLSNV